MLEDAGLVENKGGALRDEPRGIRAIGRTRSVSCSAAGRGTRAATTPSSTSARATSAASRASLRVRRPLQPDIQRTVRNAIRRTGGGTPCPLAPDDFEIEQTETSQHLSADARVSLPCRCVTTGGREEGGKALNSLITSRSPATTWHGHLRGGQGVSHRCTSRSLLYSTYDQMNYKIAPPMLSHSPCAGRQNQGTNLRYLSTASTRPLRSGEIRSRSPATRRSSTVDATSERNALHREWIPSITTTPNSRTPPPRYQNIIVHRTTHDSSHLSRGGRYRRRAGRLCAIPAGRLPERRSATSRAP
jgi:hypothetical protein